MTAFGGGVTNEKNTLAFPVGAQVTLAGTGMCGEVLAHERTAGSWTYKVGLTNGREVSVAQGGLELRGPAAAKAMTWRDALLAMAADARVRAANSEPMKSGPSDEAYLAERRGARYAFNVMATELEYMADRSNNREAIKRLRRLLEKAGKK